MRGRGRDRAAPQPMRRWGLDGAEEGPGVCPIAIGDGIGIGIGIGGVGLRLGCGIGVRIGI